MSTIHQQIPTRLREMAAIARRFHWWMLLAPLAVVGAVLLLMHTMWFTLAAKDVQEIISPSLLFLAVAVSAWLWWRGRQAWCGWLVLLAGSLFLRELHLPGTNNGIYVILALLFWHLAGRAERMRPFIEDRRIVTLLLGSMLMYTAAKTFDRGYWRAIYPAVESWRDYFEETLETTGHLMILAMVLLTWRLLRRDVSMVLPRRTMAAGLCGGLIVATLAAVAMSGADPAHDAPPRPLAGFPSELSSICRVSSTLGDNVFLASSDESRDLYLWTNDERGQAVCLSTLKLSIPDGQGGTYHLDDLEEIAWDGHSTYYAVSSHRHLLPAEQEAKWRQSRGTCSALVRFRLQRVDQEVRVVSAETICRDLLERIRAEGVFHTINWSHSRAFRWRKMSKSWQIDLEGMTVANGKLLLGFKNPIEKGRATILRFDPARDRLTVAARPDFNGQGILSLCYDAAEDRLLALTNDPQKGSFGDSRLWVAKRHPSKRYKWVFPPEPALVLEEGAAGRKRKASGMALLNGRLFVSFDHSLAAFIEQFAPPRQVTVRIARDVPALPE